MTKFQITLAVQAMLNEMMIKMIRLINEKIFNMNGTQDFQKSNISIDGIWHSADIDYFDF